MKKILTVSRCRKHIIPVLISRTCTRAVRIFGDFQIVCSVCFFLFQGSMLSAFFWGYTMTQVAGGYLSDRIGGDRVMTVSVVGWSLLTFWTPWLVYIYPDKATLLSFIVFTRVVMGCLQGNFTTRICHFYFLVAFKQNCCFSFETKCVLFNINNTLTLLPGVHYPSISSVLGRHIPKSDRAFCFATACSGGHLG